MAEINKLSVGKVLDKLRREAPASKLDQLDEKTRELDKQIRNLQIARERIERDQARSRTNPRLKTIQPSTRGPEMLVVVLAVATLFVAGLAIWFFAC